MLRSIGCIEEGAELGVRDRYMSMMRGRREWIREQRMGRGSGRERKRRK